jgi:hypothetical protein
MVNPELAVVLLPIAEGYLSEAHGYNIPTYLHG